MNDSDHRNETRATAVSDLSCTARCTASPSIVCHVSILEILNPGGCIVVWPNLPTFLGLGPKLSAPIKKGKDHKLMLTWQIRRFRLPSHDQLPSRHVSRYRKQRVVGAKIEKDACFSRCCRCIRFALRPTVMCCKNEYREAPRDGTTKPFNSFS